jgi:hypothetical protein
MEGLTIYFRIEMCLCEMVFLFIQNVKVKGKCLPFINVQSNSNCIRFMINRCDSEILTVCIR